MKELNDRANLLRWAIRDGNSVSAISMLEQDDELRRHVTPFGTWLHVAAAFGRLDVLDALVRLGADVNARGGIHGGNALNQAASEGQLEAVEYLLRAGAEMDVSEPTWNPLFAAVHEGRLDIAKILIANGIDHTVRYTGERMKDTDAEAFARLWGRTEIAEYLASLPRK